MALQIDPLLLGSPDESQQYHFVFPCLASRACLFSLLSDPHGPAVGYRRIRGRRGGGLFLYPDNAAPFSKHGRNSASVL
jgi:hypothetical protein